MLGRSTIAVVVPAYDEAQLVRGVIDGIPSFVDSIIVVDDGSRDATAEILRAAPPRVDVVTHESNRGVGAAVATGCRRAWKQGFDWVAVMAADGQMDPNDLPAILEPLQRGAADFVKGNRLDWPGAWGAMPCHRWLGNHVLSFITRLALGFDTRDSQCGYVALNRRALGDVPWRALWQGYGYPNDLLGQVLLRDLRVCEVPVRPVYGAERSGIRLRHAVGVIPFVICRAWLRRRRQGAIEPAWPTSTSSTAMQTVSARSRSSATPIPETRRSSPG